MKTGLGRKTSHKNPRFLRFKTKIKNMQPNDTRQHENQTFLSYDFSENTVLNTN